MGCNDLWLVTELPEGAPDRTGQGLLSYGARLSKLLDSSWRALVFSPLGLETRQMFADYGVPEVTILKNAERYLDTPQILGAMLAGFVAEQNGGIIAFAHNDLGCTLAPLLAARLDAALVTEVNALSRNDQGIQLSRRVMGRRIDEARIWHQRGFLLITVPVNALSPVSLHTDAKTSLQINEYISPAEAELAESATKCSVIVERIPSDPQTVDLTDADVIFCAGKGCDNADFEQLRELCRLLGTSLGVTRPVYDLGWADFDRMVGRTGRCVKPRLYVTFGVSGSMHHVGGIQDAQHIVAINNDAKAPIFPNADQGFVADVKEILPRLLERVRTATGGK
ncbi:electron transfer flavoprotein subunit alpha/FixB family protein [uncultured Desulfobacter sp.]|uniref:electron transfer flavoprotein subunit alpha/FixB family protein n=1 Tax=uncultured Desulfobacter sp. TaxID=240139 RepID=UPI002AAA9D5D|nr:electron transfer flavoprotein subunit alpha/FixB family protein [uncultured Desulfobacter sp.]